MRKKIYEVIERSGREEGLSNLYDWVMMITIILSLIPLAFKEETLLFTVIDKVAVCIFIIDYLLRWMTADFKYNKRSVTSFLRYPFGFMAIIDLLSILPSLNVLNAGLKSLRVLRLARSFRALRVFRVAKTIRYSKNIQIIGNVVRKSKDALFAVETLALGYVVVSALIVFNIEPETFGTFFDALYWATVSLTTVGYGDVYCVSTAGRIVTMLSAFVGIAIVALPAGIVTAGYMTEIMNP